MRAHACAHVLVHIHMYIHMCAHGNQPWLLFYFIQWGTILQQNPSLTNMASLTSQPALGTPCFCLPRLELRADHLAVKWILVIQTQVPVLAQPVSHHQVTPPALFSCLETRSHLIVRLALTRQASYLSLASTGNARMHPTGISSHGYVEQGGTVCLARWPPLLTLRKQVTMLERATRQGTEVASLSPSLWGPEPYQ